MGRIPPLRPIVGARLVEARELEKAPRALVRLGVAPDGLPWLCHIDRSDRITLLMQTIARVFDVPSIQELPPALQQVITDDLAQGLMGMHDAVFGESGPQRGYVTRSSARAILGRSLLSLMLDPPAPVHAPAAAAPSSDLDLVTAALAFQQTDVQQQAAARVGSARHVVLTLGGGAWTATVASADRALRRPSAPWRSVVFESLAALAGATARIEVDGDRWRVPLRDGETYSAGLMRAGEARTGGWVQFEVPRTTVLALLVEVARLVGRLHEAGVVHGDLTPGNILLDGVRPSAPDALLVPIGTAATAATFEWAAPEQIVGKPIDPRADVYTIGKMACALVGAVPFGEQITYVVPTGGQTAKSIGLLKTDGVFVDPLALGVDRAWQSRWQDALSRLVAYDPARRPEDGAAAARLLAELAENAPPPGVLAFDGPFGELVPLVQGSETSLARVVRDGGEVTRPGEFSQPAAPR